MAKEKLAQPNWAIQHAISKAIPIANQDRNDVLTSEELSVALRYMQNFTPCYFASKPLDRINERIKGTSEKVPTNSNTMMAVIDEIKRQFKAGGGKKVEELSTDDFVCVGTFFLDKLKRCSKGISEREGIIPHFVRDSCNVR